MLPGPYGVRSLYLQGFHPISEVHLPVVVLFSWVLLFLGLFDLLRICRRVCPWLRIPASYLLPARYPLAYTFLAPSVGLPPSLAGHQT